MLRKRKSLRTILTVGFLIMITIALIPEVCESAGKEPIVFRYATFGQVTMIDPSTVVGDQPTIVTENLYDPLLYPVGEKPWIKPWIAESWAIAEDKKTYTFQIAKGIKFHDGTELTAEDVAFTMVRNLRIGRGYSWAWLSVLEPKDVEVVDLYTVVFRLKKPFAPFLATLIQLRVLNKQHLIKHIKKPGEYGEFGDYGMEYLQDHDAGSGPYILESIKRAEKVILKKFDDYWKGWEENSIDRVEYFVIPEESTMMGMFESKQLDMLDEWRTMEAYERLSNIEGVNVPADIQPLVYVYQINNKKPPFDDINVRKAVSLAIDYNSAVTNILKGAEQARTPVPSVLPGHNDALPLPHRDLEKAKEYLKKSKYSMDDLKKMTITEMLQIGNPVHEKMAFLAMSNLNDIGLNVELVKVRWAEWTTRAATPESMPHMAPIMIAAKYLSPDYHTYNLYHPDSWGNYMSCSFYSNPKASELLETARATIDDDKRYRIYREAQKIIVDDAASVWVAYPKHRVAMWDYVKGYEWNPGYTYEMRFDNYRIVK